MAKLTDGNISYWRMSCRFLQNNTAMHKEVASEIEKAWLSRLAQDELPQTLQQRESIVQWLVGEVKEQWNSLTLEQQEMTTKSLNCRYQILTQCYLNVPPKIAHHHLINRLGSLLVLRYNLKSWLASSREGRQAMIEVVGQVIEEMLNNDRYCQQQMAWVAKCTSDENLRNGLLFTNLEEYSRRLVENQPLFLHRLVDYLRLHRQDRSVRLLAEPLMLLEQLDAPKHPLEHPVTAQFSQVRLEVRYPISA